MFESVIFTVIWYADDTTLLVDDNNALILFWTETFFLILLKIYFLDSYLIMKKCHIKTMVRREIYCNLMILTNMDKISISDMCQSARSDVMSIDS